MYAVATGDFNKSTRFFKPKKNSNPFFSFLAPSITSINKSEQVKYAQTSCDVIRKRSGTSAPISIKDLMDKEVLDLFLSASRLGRTDLTCSLRMMLVMEGTRKEKEGLDLFLKNLVDLLK